MANENKNRVFIGCHLVKIEWGGADTHYLITKLGYVNYLGQNWYGKNATFGQIIGLGSVSTKIGVVPNTDLTLRTTPLINGKLNDGTWQNVKVTIYEGARNSVTGAFTPLATENIWRIMGYSNSGGLRGDTTFELEADGLSDMKNFGNAWTFSSESQKALTSTTDTGFRYISNQSASMADFASGGGGSYPPILTGGNLYNSETFNAG